jgi:exonuclease III
MAEPTSDYDFLSWNVRGLNNPAKQKDVRQVVQTFKPFVVCMQETKLYEISSSTMASAWAQAI